MFCRTLNVLRYQSIVLRHISYACVISSFLRHLFIKIPILSVPRFLLMSCVISPEQSHQSSAPFVPRIGMCSGELFSSASLKQPCSFTIFLFFSHQHICSAEGPKESRAPVQPNRMNTSLLSASRRKVVDTGGRGSCRELNHILMGLGNTEVLPWALFCIPDATRYQTDAHKLGSCQIVLFWLHIKLVNSIRIQGTGYARL